MNKIKSFLGTGWKFPPSFQKDIKGPNMVSDETDIEESLEIILSTQVRERIMQPDFGADLHSFLYKPMSAATQALIKDMIFDAIYSFESRIQPDDVILTGSPTEGEMILNIQYTIRATNTRYNMVYPFYIGEGTLL